MNVDERDKLIMAVEMVLNDKQTSATYLEKKMKISFKEALLIIEKMEQLNIISKQIKSQPREILINENEWKEMKKLLLNAIKKE